MKKRTSNIKQHYVPQFYLRNFTDSKGKIKVYDLIRENSYLVSPSKVCYEKYFHDIDTDVIKLFSNSLLEYEELVDDNIRKLNEETSAVLLNFLNDIKDCKTTFDFSKENRDKLYNFIVLQTIRSPFYRKRLRYLNLPFCLKTGVSCDLGDETIQDIIHNLLILGVLGRLHNEDFKLNELYYSVFEHLIDEILDLKKQLENCGKLFLVNKTNGEFICSTTPVNMLWKQNLRASKKALVTPLGDDKLFDFGEYMEFQTIFLPISSDVGIFLFDKECNAGLNQMNQGIGIIEDWNSDLLVNLNLSSMLKNKDKIFSASGDFSEILELMNNRINPRMEFRFGKQ